MCFFKITAYLEIFWRGHKGWPGAGVFRMRAQHCCRNVTGQTLPRVCGGGLHHCRVIEIKSKIRIHRTLRIQKTFPLDWAFIYRASEAVSKPRHGLNPFLPEVSSLQESQRRWHDRGSDLLLLILVFQVWLSSSKNSEKSVLWSTHSPPSCVLWLSGLSHLTHQVSLLCTGSTHLMSLAWG